MSLPFFSVTKAIREELDVLTVKARWGDETEQRAFNTKLWGKLQKEAKAERKKEAAENNIGGKVAGAMKQKQGPDAWRAGPHPRRGITRLRSPLHRQP